MLGIVGKQSAGESVESVLSRRRAALCRARHTWRGLVVCLGSK